MSGKLDLETLSVRLKFEEEYHSADTFGMTGHYIVKLKPSDTDLNFEPVQMQLTYILSGVLIF